MRAFNASSQYITAEFRKCGCIRLETIIPLGESGEWLGTPPGAPVANVHSFDQQPLFTRFQLKSDAPFDQVECALDNGICKLACCTPPPVGPVRFAQ
jgi:hypothetical protein